MKNCIVLVLMTFFFQSVSGFYFTFGDEQVGNNSTSRTNLDTQAQDRVDGFGSGYEFNPLNFGAASTSTDFPDIATYAVSGVVISLSLRDMVDLGSNSIGNLSNSPATAQAGPTLQDGAAKPQSRYTTSSPHSIYRNDLAGSNSSRNALLIGFSGSIAGFGGWFGDVETRSDGLGTQAEIRLLDNNLNLLHQEFIPTSTADQSQCGSPTNDDFAGCGNKTSRWIGFTNSNSLPIAYALYIIGDDDTNTGSNNGFGEHISFLGGIVSSTICIPNAELCDGLDNNCNGDIDEGLDQIISCSEGTGSCNSTGTTTVSCISGSYITGTCSAIPTLASNELCDGVDNDCDGSIDNDIQAISYPCSVGTGGCFATGTFMVSCLSGSIHTGTCAAIAGEPSNERCDFVDNNCNGLVDDGLICGGGSSFKEIEIPSIISSSITATSFYDKVEKEIKRIVHLISPNTFQVIEGEEQNTTTLTIAPITLPKTGAE